MFILLAENPIGLWCEGILGWNLDYGVLIEPCLKELLLAELRDNWALLGLILGSGLLVLFLLLAIFILNLGLLLSVPLGSRFNLITVVFLELCFGLCDVHGHPALPLLLLLNQSLSVL